MKRFIRWAVERCVECGGPAASRCNLCYAWVCRRCANGHVCSKKRKV